MPWSDLCCCRASFAMIATVTLKPSALSTAIQDEQQGQVRSYSTWTMDVAAGPGRESARVPMERSSNRRESFGIWHSFELSALQIFGTIKRRSSRSTIVLTNRPSRPNRNAPAVWFMV